MPPGANATVSVLAAHNGPCVIMQSDVATGVAVKCWGPNGYGSLGLVRHRFFFPCQFIPQAVGALVFFCFVFLLGNVR